MASAYAEGGALAAKTAKQVARNSKARKVITGTTSHIVGKVVTAKTGSATLGRVASHAVKSRSKETTEAVTFVGTTAALAAGSVAAAGVAMVAVPILVFKGIWDSIFSD